MTQISEEMPKAHPIPTEDRYQQWRNTKILRIALLTVFFVGAQISAHAVRGRVIEILVIMPLLIGLGVGVWERIIRRRYGIDWTFLFVSSKRPD